MLTWKPRKGTINSISSSQQRKQTRSYANLHIQAPDGIFGVRLFWKAASVSTSRRVTPFLTRGKCVFRKSASQRKGEWGGDLSWVCCLNWVLKSVFHAKNGFEIKYRPMFINKQKRRNRCAGSPKWKTALSNRSNWQKKKKVCELAL